MEPLSNEIYHPVYPKARLDAKGRCCGRKPLVYKSPPPHRFCIRCDRAYHLIKNQQIENWAWKQAPDTVKWEQRDLGPIVLAIFGVT